MSRWRRNDRYADAFEEAAHAQEREAANRDEREARMIEEFEAKISDLLSSNDRLRKEKEGLEKERDEFLSLLRAVWTADGFIPEDVSARVDAVLKSSLKIEQTGG